MARTSTTIRVYRFPRDPANESRITLPEAPISTLFGGWGIVL